MRPTVALSCILKNEAHNIGPMLQSFRGCVDEIVMVDTGSTDGSIEFLERINGHIADGNPSWSGLPKITIAHFKWVDDFSKARQYSMDLCKSDYVLWADLDDALSDAKAFIEWRDTVLHTAHYWAVTYNYAFDKTGKVECQFVRERVVKNNFGFQWKYFVHEGLMYTGTTPFWPNRVTTWAVNHRRTDEDRAMDHKRNVSLFDKHDKESLPARMKYYLGKEMVENGMAREAGKWLLEALKDPALDIHDRIMAFQYAAQSAFAAGEYVTVINLCRNSLMLTPSRAECYCLMGDAYLAQGDPGNAATLYRQALQCRPDNLGGIVVTFQPAYGDYPHTKLAEVALNQGDHLGAREHVEFLKASGNINAPAYEKWISDVEDMATIRTNLPEVDDVAIICPPQGAVSDWDENTLATKGHGGSETAAIEVAKELALKTKRKIKLFQPRAKREVMPSGVEYLPMDALRGYITNVRPKAVINWRHPTRLSEAPTVVWCHDLLCPNASPADKYDKIFALSEFHKNYLHQVQGISKDKITLLTNGINPADFPADCERNPNKIIFSSSPDRGLDRAIRIVEAARKQSGLDLTLDCFYGFENMRKSGQPQWIKQADDIEAMIAERPWVHYHGFVNKQTLMRHFQESAVWIYPANFIETYCITAIEALAAGAYPIVRDMGALKYTMKEAIEKDMCEFVSTDCETDAEVGIWANRVVEAVIERKWERVKIDKQDYTWGKVADRFIEELNLGCA